MIIISWKGYGNLTFLLNMYCTMNVFDDVIVHLLMDSLEGLVFVDTLDVGGDDGLGGEYSNLTFIYCKCTVYTP